MLNTEAMWDHQLHAHTALFTPHSSPSDEVLPAPDAQPAVVPICEEAILAAEALEDLPAPIAACTAEERGYKPRPKKGRPIDKGPVLRQHLQECSDKIVVCGPDYIGVTTLLRGLEKLGYAVDVCRGKPPAEAREAFCNQHFNALVSRWARLTTHSGVLLIEESPWSYLAKHAHHLDAPTRAACNAALAPLVLPTLTVSLHSSGREVGRRHPLHHQEPDKHGQVAIEQMVQLQLLPHACYHVDASVMP